MFIKSKKNLRGTEIEDYLLTATEKEASHMERPMEKKWFDFVWFGLVILMFILLGRAFYLTIIKGAYYQEVSKGNSIRSVVIKAPRGKIFDRFGTPLVNNMPSVDIVAVPAELPTEKNELDLMIEKISEITNLNEGDIFEKINSAESNSQNSVLVKDNVPQDEWLVILEKSEKFPGIKIENTAIREYINSSIFSHIIGYEGKIERKELNENSGYLLTDYIGKQGIEKTYEKNLRGVHGAMQLEVDSMGNPKRKVGIINPKPGSDLILSIDAELQKKIYDSLSTTLEKTKVRTASAVALNPNNGEILALVNLPSYDNNLFSQKISQSQYNELIQNPDKPLFNRAISGEYAPGSTVKPVIAAAALSEKVITPSTIINGLGGVLRIGSFSFRDWTVHGPSEVKAAIAESNDIFFYTIGGGYGNIEGLGIDRMKKYYNLYGYGEKTGIDLTGEVSGFIPDEEWKINRFNERWFVGNNYHASIGQGYITSTPLQVANSITPIINGGKLYKPHVVSQIRNHEGEIRNIETEVISNTQIPADIAKVVKEGMRMTVTEGTAKYLRDLPVEVAGKTGTAQFGNEDKTHIWFVSFAPYENPEIVMVVLVEGVGDNSSSAVPVTKEVYDWYFSRDKK